MKISIERNKLFDGLQDIFSIVPQKPTLPILTNFLLKTSSGSLTVSGTDMDISITTSLECTVEEEGAVAVNAKRFLGFIRELPEGNVEIQVVNERVTVDFKHGQSSLMGMSSSDFPALRESVEGVTLEISSSDFAEMVEKTSFSVASERTRISLTGVYWNVSSDSMFMVATDGHRLAMLKKQISAENKLVSEAIIPPKTLNQASRILATGMELKHVIFGDGVIYFDFSTTKIFSKLIEGPYPNFRQVIPLESSKKVYISTEKLLTSARRVSVLSNSLTHQIRLSFSPGWMEITTTNLDIGGEARDSAEIRYEGDPLTIGVNASFLLEILRRIDSDEIVMELESPTSACIIKPVGVNEGEEQLYLIMPLRLNE